MRAVKLEGTSVRLLAAAPDPALLPGEALVHPTRLLVGAADLQALSAADRGFGIPGHQFVGVVKKVAPPQPALSGPGSSPLSAPRAALMNKRVVGSPLLICAQCDLCRSGLSSHCRARRVLGLWAREGCFADLFAIPLASLCAVPDAVDDDRAVFAHAAAGAAQAAHMLRPAAGGVSGGVDGRRYITVIGDDAGALITAQLFSRDNKCTRLLFTRPDRARLCERWGIRHRAVEEPGRRQDQDAVIDCTGTPAGLRLALQLVRPRGTVLLKSPAAGAPFPPGHAWPESAAWKWPVDLTPAVVNEVRIIGCREAPIGDGLGLIADGKVDVADLCPRRFKLDDAPAAYAAAASGDHPATVMDA